MTTHLKRKPKISTGPDGRVRIEPKRAHRSVSQRIGADKKAQRRAAAWAKAAPKARKEDKPKARKDDLKGNTSTSKRGTR